ncbi:hypothetical protein ACFLQ1_00035 [Candidatus Auribacterota bacterium]
MSFRKNKIFKIIFSLLFSLNMQLLRPSVALPEGSSYNFHKEKLAPANKHLITLSLLKEIKQEELDRETVKTFLEQGGKVNVAACINDNQVTFTLLTPSGPMGITTVPCDNGNSSGNSPAIMASTVSGLFFAAAGEYGLNPEDIGSFGLAQTGASTDTNSPGFGQTDQQDEAGNPFNDSSVPGSTFAPQGLPSKDIGIFGLAQTGASTGINSPGFGQANRPDDAANPFGDFTTPGSTFAPQGLPFKENLGGQLAQAGFSPTIFEFSSEDANALGEYGLSANQNLPLPQAQKGLTDSQGYGIEYIIAMPKLTNYSSTFIFANRIPINHKLFIDYHSGERSIIEFWTLPTMAKRIIKELSYDLGAAQAKEWLGASISLNDIFLISNLNLRELTKPSARNINQKKAIAKLYQVLEEKFLSSDEWIIQFSKKIESEMGKFLNLILMLYPKGYFINLEFNDQLKFRMLKLPYSYRNTQIVIKGKFLEKLYDLRHLAPENVLRSIRLSADLDPISTQILRGSYQKDTWMYAFLPLKSSQKDMTKKEDNIFDKKNLQAKRILPAPKEIVPLKQYLYAATKFFSKKYKIKVGEESILYLLLSSQSQIGKNISVREKTSLLINSFDQNRAKVMIGDNVRVMADIEVSVKGGGELIIEPNTTLRQNLKISVAETEIAIINEQGVRLAIKEKKEIIDNILNRLLLLGKKRRTEIVINTVNSLLLYLEELKFSESQKKALEENLHFLLSEREATYFWRLINKIKRQYLAFSSKGKENSAFKKKTNITSSSRRLDNNLFIPLYYSEGIDVIRILEEKLKVLEALLKEKLFRRMMTMEKLLKLALLLSRST